MTAELSPKSPRENGKRCWINFLRREHHEHDERWESEVGVPGAGGVDGMDRGGLAETRRLPEINYAARFCIAEGGVLEKRLPDRSEPDCSTDTNVIEADFGDKDRESVNQIERYMYHDPKKRKGGILLILENDNKRYIRELCDVIEKKKLPPDIWPPDIWIMYSDFTYQSYSCNGGKFGPLKTMTCQVTEVEPLVHGQDAAVAAHAKMGLW